MKCESQQSQRRLDVAGSNNLGRDSKCGRGRTFRMKENTSKARRELAAQVDFAIVKPQDVKDSKWIIRFGLFITNMVTDY